MFKQLDLKIIGGIIIVAVLILSGIHFYSKWSYNRFASEIGAAPQSTSPDEDASESDKITPSEQSKQVLSPTKSTNKIIKGQPKSIVESKSTNSTEDKEATAEKTEAPAFDASTLLSAFGIPEEVTTLLGEDVEEADFEKAQAHFTEKYGQSPEVEAIIDRLKQMSGGPVSLDDLTDLFETWVQVLPEDQHENRQHLMKVVTILNQIRAKGDNIPVHIAIDTQVVAPDLDTLDPSLLEGDNVESFQHQTIVTEVIDGSETIED